MDLQVGEIIYTQIGDIHGKKKKYCLCVLIEKKIVTNEYSFFLINSENREIYECTVIKKADHPFLQYDSHISCSQLFKISSQQLSGYEAKGSLSPQEIERLIHHVNNNVKRLTRKDKNAVIASLERLYEDLAV